MDGFGDQWDVGIVGVQNPIARSWTSQVSRGQGKGSYIPYRINGKTEVWIKAEPKTSYDWVAMPSGQKGTLTANQEGFFVLGFSGTSHEIFYYSKSGTNQDRLEEILKRKTTLNSAISLNQIPQVVE